MQICECADTLHRVLDEAEGIQKIRYQELSILLTGGRKAISKCLCFTVSALFAPMRANKSSLADITFQPPPALLNCEKVPPQSYFRDTRNWSEYDRFISDLCVYFKLPAHTDNTVLSLKCAGALETSNSHWVDPNSLCSTDKDDEIRVSRHGLYQSMSVMIWVIVSGLYDTKQSLNHVIKVMKSHCR